MIVVDTSALVALLVGEAGADAIEERLLGVPTMISAANRVELGIVVEARSGPAGTQLLDELLGRLGTEVVPVDAELAEEAVACWRHYGKGRHRAGLNYGDTFSYALAHSRGLPLLFVGDDFAHTDVEVA